MTHEIISIVETVTSLGARGPVDPFIESIRPRMIWYWVARAARRLPKETGDPRGQFLWPHEIRGIWATNVAQTHDVDPLPVRA